MGGINAHCILAEAAPRLAIVFSFRPTHHELAHWHGHIGLHVCYAILQGGVRVVNHLLLLCEDQVDPDTGMSLRNSSERMVAGLGDARFFAVTVLELSLRFFLSLPLDISSVACARREHALAYHAVLVRIPHLCELCFKDLQWTSRVGRWPLPEPGHVLYHLCVNIGGFYQIQHALHHCRTRVAVEQGGLSTLGSCEREC